MRYKVCVYAICKNEEQFVDRWMDSMSEADVVVVTDTGSSDETVARLKKRGGIVYSETVTPWRFDVARNLSLSHVPEDADICVCTDLDEVFRSGWRQKLEEVWQVGATMGNYLYTWSHKPDGTPDVQFTYFKIHDRNSYRWVHPVHECLAFCGTKPEKKVSLSGVELSHFPDDTKSRGSYLPLLELAVAEKPMEDRMNFYLGREYFFKGMWESAIAALERYLALPTADWREERSAAMSIIARCQYNLRHITDSSSWFYRAVAEAPHLREPYIDCARVGYEQNNWPLVFYMTDTALKIKEKSTLYINMGYAWDETPDDLCAIACYRLEMYDRSLAHAKAALSFNQNDDRLIGNLRMIEEKCSHDTKNGL